MKIKPKEKKHSELVWSPQDPIWKSSEVCHVSSPVFGRKGAGGCVGRGKNCRVGKPRVLIQTSEDSSVSFIICVFYQYLSVTSLGSGGSKGEKEQNRALSPLLKCKHIHSIRSISNLTRQGLRPAPDGLFLEFQIQFKVLLGKH